MTEDTPPRKSFSDRIGDAVLGFGRTVPIFGGAPLSKILDVTVGDDTKHASSMVQKAASHWRAILSEAAKPEATFEATWRLSNLEYVTSIPASDFRNSVHMKNAVTALGERCKALGLEEDCKALGKVLENGSLSTQEMIRELTTKGEELTRKMAAELEKRGMSETEARHAAKEAFRTTIVKGIAATGLEHDCEVACSKYPGADQAKVKARLDEELRLIAPAKDLPSPSAVPSPLSPPPPSTTETKVEPSEPPKPTPEVRAEPGEQPKPNVFAFPKQDLTLSKSAHGLSTSEETLTIPKERLGTVVVKSKGHPDLVFENAVVLEMKNGKRKVVMSTGVTHTVRDVEQVDGPVINEKDLPSIAKKPGQEKPREIRDGEHDLVPITPPSFSPSPAAEGKPAPAPPPAPATTTPAKVGRAHSGTLDTAAIREARTLPSYNGDAMVAAPDLKNLLNEAEMGKLLETMRLVNKGGSVLDSGTGNTFEGTRETVRSSDASLPVSEILDGLRR